jgi:hypothetical protein
MLEAIWYTVGSGMTLSKQSTHDGTQHYYYELTVLFAQVGQYYMIILPIRNIFKINHEY